jgi:hypothetical protein
LLGVSAWLALAVAALSAVRLMRSSQGGRTGKKMLLHTVCFLVSIAYFVDAVAEGEILRRFAQDDSSYFEQLCRERAGDKIFRTVDDVEGVLQMKLREPDQDRQWADQFGMVDPWAQAFGDQAYINGWLSKRGQGYWFIEQVPAVHGEPHLRTFLQPTGKTVGEKYPYGDHNSDPELVLATARDQTRLARYGYTTVDLTTHEMRARWMGGGTLRIVDLDTMEILAERTGFYRAMGPQVKLAWTWRLPCPASSSGIVKSPSLPAFVMAVLKPPLEVPTRSQLEKYRTN